MQGFLRQPLVGIRHFAILLLALGPFVAPAEAEHYHHATLVVTRDYPGWWSFTLQFIVPETGTCCNSSLSEGDLVIDFGGGSYACVGYGGYAGPNTKILPATPPGTYRYNLGLNQWCDGASADFYMIDHPTSGPGSSTRATFSHQYYPPGIYTLRWFYCCTAQTAGVDVRPPPPGFPLEVM